MISEKTGCHFNFEVVIIMNPMERKSKIINRMTKNREIGRKIELILIDKCNNRCYICITLKEVQ